MGVPATMYGVNIHNKDKTSNAITVVNTSTEPELERVYLDNVNTICELNFDASVGIVPYTLTLDLQTLGAGTYLIIAGDGLYRYFGGDFGYVLTKEKFKYVNNSLIDIDLKNPTIFTSIPKPPVEIYDKILDIFKYIHINANSEVMVNLYYDKRLKKFEIDVPDQEISAASAKYNTTYKYENSENRYVKYFQVHSHNTMDAFFSGTDDEDDKNRPMCYIGVVGKINKNTNSSNSTEKFRMWAGGEFLEINRSSIFKSEEKEESNFKFNKTIQTKLDEIIEKHNTPKPYYHHYRSPAYDYYNNRPSYYNNDKTAEKKDNVQTLSYNSKYGWRNNYQELYKNYSPMSEKVIEDTLYGVPSYDLKDGIEDNNKNVFTDNIDLVESDAQPPNDIKIYDGNGKLLTGNVERESA